MLKQAGQQAPESKPVLEVNPEHPLVKKLAGDTAHFDDLANILELAGQADVRILILDADAPVLLGLPLAEP